jgi:hypothetical protein
VRKASKLVFLRLMATGAVCKEAGCTRQGGREAYLRAEVLESTSTLMGVAVLQILAYMYGCS